MDLSNDPEPSWAANLVGRRDQPGSWPAPPPPTGDWQLATVTSLSAETPDAITLRMRRSSGGGFLAGQHFHIEVPTGARFSALETYSVASSPWPDPATVEFTVKEVPGGRVSPILVHKVPVGAELRIQGPFGHLTWNETDGGPLALIAGGSGIVPLMALIRYAVARDLHVPMRLLYSSKDRPHTIYHREISRLVSRNPWFEVVQTFTGDGSDPGARHHRRIDAEMVAEIFAPIASECLAYMCGPSGLVRTATTALNEIGVNQSRMVSEEWE